MDHEHQYLETIMEVMEERHWIKDFDKEANEAARKMVLRYKEKDRKFTKAQNKEESQNLIQSLHLDLRQILSDRLITEKLATNHPGQIKTFEARLERLKPATEKSELQAKEKAEALLKICLKIESTLNKSDEAEKHLALKSLYKDIKEAYADPLLKLHIQERPAIYRKLEQHMNGIIKEKLNDTFEKELGQNVTKEINKTSQIEFKKRYDREIEF